MKKLVQKPTFIDANEKYAPSTHFDVINEEPEVWNSLLGRQRFGKIATIASAGEILLFVLAHRATEEIIAVDHSYSSMRVCYAKALFVQKHGARLAHKLITQDGWKGYKDSLAQIVSELPTVLQNPKRPTWDAPRTPEFVLNDFNDQKYRAEWHYGGVTNLERGARMLQKTTFIHGDFSDTAQYGPFDLLYVSNAQEHTNKNNVRPSVANDFIPLVRVGGLVLICATSYYPAPNDPTYRIVQTVKGFRNVHNWTYYILERTA